MTVSASPMSAYRMSARGSLRVTSAALQIVARKGRHVRVDLRQVARFGEKHDAQEAFFGAHPESGTMDTEDPGLAEQGEDVVLVGFSRRQGDRRERVERRTRGN